MSSDIPGDADVKVPARARRPIGTGRRGAIAKALLAALADARAADRMTTEHELVGAMAMKVAAVVDNAASTGDAAGMLRAINSLRDLIDTLPIRTIRPAAGGDDDGADDRPAELKLLTGPPTLGDTADS